MSKMLGLFSNFRIRKRVLALADGFIVVVAGLFANFFLPLFANSIDRADQFAIFFLSVILCFSSLLFFGAYNKLWRVPFPLHVPKCFYFDYKYGTP